MKRFAFILLISFVILSLTGLVWAQDSTQVQTQSHGTNFVDEDGDGMNDKQTGAQGQGQDQKKGNRQQKCQRKGQGFMDVDGDGLNDWSQDADGDGIPNGQDEDFVKSGDGEGGQSQGGSGHEDWQSGQGSDGGNCDGSGSGSGQGRGKGGREGGGKK